MPRGHPWPEEVRARLVERVAKGETLGAASRALGVPKVTAQGWVAAAGVERSTPKEAQEQTAAATAARRRQLEDSKDRRAGGLSALAELAIKEVGDRLRDDKRRKEISVRELVGVFTRANHDVALLTGQATEAADVRVFFNVPLPDEAPPPVVEEDDLPRLGP